MDDRRGARDRAWQLRGHLTVAVVVALAASLATGHPSATAGEHTVHVVTTEQELRAAIEAGNAGLGPYELRLDYAGTLALTAPLPALTRTVTVRGRSADETVLDGNGHATFGQAVLASYASGAHVAIYYLTMATSHPSPGQAVYTEEGDVTIVAAEVRGHAASGNGGAILAVWGDVTVTDSTFVGNRAGSGGAALAAGFGRVHVTTSTFVGNDAASGGAIRAGRGGAVTGSTVVGNAGGGVRNDGIDGAELVVRNTILWGNAGGDCLGPGVVATGGHNIDGDGTCALDAALGDHPGVAAEALALDGIGDHGGPTTTYALRPASVAVGAGDVAWCTGLDQRQVPRKDPCDIGAYETPPAAPDPEPGGDPGPGAGPPPDGESPTGGGTPPESTTGGAVTDGEPDTESPPEAEDPPISATGPGGGSVVGPRPDRTAEGGVDRLATRMSLYEVARVCGPARATFDDVRADDAHAAGIGCVVALGLARGAAGGSFLAGATITRAQLATMLHGALRLVGAGPPEATGRFDDVGGPHAAAIESLAAAGLVLGTGLRTFSPGEPVTRGQAATLLARVHAQVAGDGVSLDAVAFDVAYDDVGGSLHAPAIARLTALGIVTGVAPRSFSPGAYVTRGQAASMVASLLLDLAAEDARQRVEPEPEARDARG